MKLPPYLYSFTYFCSTRSTVTHPESKEAKPIQILPGKGLVHKAQYKCSPGRQVSCITIQILPRKTDVMYFYCNTIQVTATFVYTLTSVPRMNCVSQMYQIHKDSLWMTAVTSTWQTDVWVHNSTPPRETDATCLQTIGNITHTGPFLPLPLFVSAHRCSQKV